MLGAIPHRAAKRHADDRETILARQFGNPLDGIRRAQRRVHQFDPVQAGVAHVLKNGRQHGGNVKIR
ncbi:MAG TPA: hypothetical protein VN829_21995 [Dongiaceae bacterium]|nr:hypothetical protein [Dongiaceae bacterium]